MRPMSQKHAIKERREEYTHGQDNYKYQHRLAWRGVVSQSRTYQNSSAERSNAQLNTQHSRILRNRRSLRTFLRRAVSVQGAERAYLLCHAQDSEEPFRCEPVRSAFLNKHGNSMRYLCII